MTNHPPILRNSLLVLPFVVVGAAAMGAEHALGAALGGSLVLGNLWVMSVLGPRIVRALARGEVPALWLVALFAKFLLLVGGLVWLVKALPPVGVALGFVPLLVGTLFTGVAMAQQDLAEET